MVWVREQSSAILGLFSANKFLGDAKLLNHSSFLLNYPLLTD
jgi:hypothetical protein